MQAMAKINTDMNKYKIVLPVIIIITLIAGILIGGVILTKYFKSKPTIDQTVIQVDKKQINQNISQDRHTAITRAIEKVSTAIVGINVEEVRTVQDPFFNDPFFRQFFGNQGPQKQVVRGLGSGYIISEDGYILTNDHVAGNATKISVTLTTGETVTAKLIGSDPVSDVALLKIDKKNLSYVNFGNSDNILIGEWVIALGNPFGLFEINDKPTVTVGVISASKMKVSAEGNRVYKDMIQTDASINAGNSGGPLVDVEGNVIGMNTIIYTGSQFSQGSIGVGFAISINRVKAIMEELKAGGKIERSTNPGFRIQGLDEQMVKYYGLKNTEGVIVTQIQRGSTADNAGLKVEDVITAVNGDKIRNEQDLIFAINDKRKGETIKMTVVRDKSEKEIEMKLE